MKNTNAVIVGCLGIVFDLIGVVVVASILFAFPTMWLWNWLMPHLFNLPQITLWEALGINLLTGLLFKSSTASSNNKGD